MAAVGAKDTHAATAAFNAMYELILDMDALVGTDAGFLLGSWLEAAGRKSPLATKNLLEDTDGLRRPP